MDYAGGMGPSFEYSPTNLFRRSCVECPPTTPSCPSCKSGQVCVQISQTCKACAYRTCVSQDESGATTATPAPSGSHPSKGAMAGGVIGGVLFVALLTFLVWRFCIKPRRAAFLDDFEDELEEVPEKHSADDANNAVAMDLRSRPSLQGRESVASTVLTRASNVIPIAFIPGIIDRSGAAPPVPPVPIPTTHTTAQGATTTLLSPYSDLHGDTYFMPGDLRDSTYSGFTTTDDAASARTGRSTATDSMVRGSVASTVYGVDANTVQAHVQTAQRARPAMVSVRSGTSRAASPVSVPAVPRIDYERYRRLSATQNVVPASASTSGASSAVQPDAFSLNSVFAGASAVPGTSLSSAASGPAERGAGAGIRAGPLPHLAAVIEEATRRASRQPMHGGLGSVRRDDSPFGDQHAIDEEDL